MKRLIIMIVAVAAVALGTVAQNANRSGFFVELGGGAIAGSPYVYFGKEDGAVLKGFDASLGLGYRYALGRACAVEMKLQISAGINDNIDDSSVISFMPGFRYTTRELFGNSSMYLGFNLGTCKFGGDYDPSAFDTYYYDNGGEGWGFSYGLTAGLNITSSWYAGLFWDGNVCSGTHWGVVGIRGGFRF